MGVIPQLSNHEHYRVGICCPCICHGYRQSSSSCLSSPLTCIPAAACSISPCSAGSISLSSWLCWYYWLPRPSYQRYQPRVYNWCPGNAAGSGIANGLGIAVGGVASGLGQGVGGVASGTGAAIGGVASGAGQTVGGTASGIGQGVGGVASGTGAAISSCFWAAQET